MFGKEIIISLCFRCANFAVLIICGTYIFRKYILPHVVFAINKQKQEYERIMHHIRDLEATHNIIKKEYEESAQLCQRLKKNIDQWKKVTEDTIAAQEKERQNSMIMLYKKKLHKEKTLEQERTHKEMINTITHEIKQSFTHHFQQKDTGSDYIGSLIHYMKKDVL